jgi:hypothetical protein
MDALPESDTDQASSQDGQDNREEGNGVRNNFSGHQFSEADKARAYFGFGLVGAVVTAIGCAMCAYKTKGCLITVLGICVGIVGIFTIYFGFLALGAN